MDQKSLSVKRPQLSFLFSIHPLLQRTNTFEQLYKNDYSFQYYASIFWLHTKIRRIRPAYASSASSTTTSLISLMQLHSPSITLRIHLSFISSSFLMIRATKKGKRAKGAKKAEIRVRGRKFNKRQKRQNASNIVLFRI